MIFLILEDKVILHTIPHRISKSPLFSFKVWIPSDHWSLKCLFAKDQWHTSKGLSSATPKSNHLDLLWTGDQKLFGGWVGGVEGHKGAQRITKKLIILSPLDPQNPHIYHSKIYEDMKLAHISNNILSKLCFK